MKNTKNIFKTALPLLLLAVLWVVSCTRYTGPDSRHAIEDRRTTRESRYNLLGFSGDDDVVTADVPAVNDTLREGSDLISFPEYTAGEEDVQVVFSVQVFASKSSEEAEEFEYSIAPMFDEEVRTDYKPPYYKVRIGRCAGLEEAEALLEKVKEMNFPNAWLVRIWIR